MSDEKNLNQMIAESEHADFIREQLAVVDFKMVTFSLAGKDYAIDIMRIKEIAKAGNFTYVPNTSPFVLGVYNLRGEIIPIMDLRIFFNIPVPPRNKGQLESMVIVDVNDQRFGVVVDVIDKVIGVSKSSIQQPHPIFGDINIKYIQGVVESGSRLYILLDVEMIFASRNKTKDPVDTPVSESTQTFASEHKGLTTKANEVLDIKFINDTLLAMGKFYPSSINEDWIKNRYEIWSDSRPSNEVQIQTQEDADAFLSGFISPFTGKFWSEEYLNSIYRALPEMSSSVINVWNIGCGSGYETYSLAIMLSMKYPTARIRIYANDSDLLAISSATMLNFPKENVPSIYKPYLVEGVNGTLSFNDKIKDMILFEYHDCAHQNVVPDFDIIFARDVLSLSTLDVQERLVTEFEEHLKSTGIIFLGSNEYMPKQSGWAKFNEGDIIFFGKE